MSCAVYFGNLPWSMEDGDLFEAVADIAEPLRLEVQRNKYGKSLGYALAEFATPEDAWAVIQDTHGKEFDGRRLNVREDRGARSKPAPSGASGSGASSGAGAGTGSARSGASGAAAPASGNRVYIGNLSWGTTDDLLMEVFEDFNIVSAAVQLQSRGQSKGWALAEFPTSEDAQNAIEAMSGTELDGRDIICREDRGPSGRSSAPGSGGAASKRSAPKPRRVIPEGAPSQSVYMGNLSWDMDDETLADVVAEFGVESVEVQTRPDGKSRGYALVRFDSVEEAQRAIDELNEVTVMGRPMLVKFDAK